MTSPEAGDVVVCRFSELSDPGRKVVAIGSTEVGIFRVGGELHAWLNVCPHMGGPACQGKMLPRTLEAVEADRSSTGRIFSKSDVHIVCPWHGFEFDVRTGRHPVDPGIRLRPVSVRRAGDDVIITLARA